MPPISSYVGYSLEEPWGEPRVVFGVAADEAEQIAVLLAGHECDGPAAPGDRGRGSHVHVPAQAPPAPASRGQARSGQADPGQDRVEQARSDPERTDRSRAERSGPERSRAERPGPEAGPGEHAAADPLDTGGRSREAGAQPGGSHSQRESAGRSARKSGPPLESGKTRKASGPPPPPAATYSHAAPPGGPAGLHPGPQSYGLPGAGGPRRADGTGELMAFRPQHEPDSYFDGLDGDPFLTGPDEQWTASRGRGARAGGSHAMPRQRRAGPQPPRPAAAGTAGRASGLDPAGRGSIPSVSAGQAGWASGELPGQASPRAGLPGTGGPHGGLPGSGRLTSGLPGTGRLSSGLPGPALPGSAFGHHGPPAGGRPGDAVF
ncbi:MAG TPA: hypothetical protein VH637_23930 [Streptosporangiaceae bacterium]